MIQYGISSTYTVGIAYAIGMVIYVCQMRGASWGLRVLEQIVYLLLGPVRHTSACRVAVESDRAPPAARASARAGKQSKQFAGPSV